MSAALRPIPYAGKDSDTPNRKPGGGAIGSYDSRGLKPKVSIGFRPKQFLEIDAESERLGVSFAEVVRTLIDEAIKARTECLSESIAKQAETVAESYEREIRNMPQACIVPEPQLSLLKAKHWRILAGWIRKRAIGEKEDRK